MHMPNEHRNAKHTDRPTPFSTKPMSVISLWDAPTDDLDMFSRWIRLSDEALVANRTARKKAAKCPRRPPVASCCV